MSKSELTTLVLVAFVLLPGPARGDDHEVTFLLLDCQGKTQPDCFEDTSSLISWIADTRQPDASAPLLVEVGPGDFDPFDCDSGGSPNFGDVTFRGVGTTLTRFAASGSAPAAISVVGCSRLEFIDLTVSNPYQTAVDWTDGGTSTWSNVDLIGGTRGWSDDCGGTPDPGSHDFFGSRIVARLSSASAATSATALDSRCGGTSVFGGVVRVEVDADAAPTSLGDVTGVAVDADGDVKLSGTNVTLDLEGLAVTSSATLRGSLVSGGRFQMNGGFVTVDASSLPDADVRGIELADSSGGVANASGTAFDLIPSSSGSVERAVGDPSLESAFAWAASNAPPVTGEGPDPLASQHGADRYVETDCDSDGDCDAAGLETHPMVYSTECDASGPDGPWFDTATGRCRGDTGS